MFKHLALGADKGDVEADWWSWLKVWKEIKINKYWLNTERVDKGWNNLPEPSKIFLSYRLQSP